MATLPKVQSDAISLYEFYHTTPWVTPGDIRKQFNCCATTASRVFAQVKKAMLDKGNLQYNPRYVSTRALFEIYNWDIKDIENSAKALIRLKKIKQGIC